MKIDINVLPDEQKEKRDQEKKISQILRLGIALIAVLLLLNVVFFFMQLVLEIEYKAVRASENQSLSKNAEERESLEKVFREASVQVATLSKIKSSLPNWARALVRISEMCPAEVKISRFQADENSLKISGFSKTRDAFIEFQKKMKEEGFEVPSNISNLVSSSDFNFDIEIKLPQEYLIRQ